jgi:hypothetical protein
MGFRRKVARADLLTGPVRPTTLTEPKQFNGALPTKHPFVRGGRKFKLSAGTRLYNGKATRANSPENRPL